jgi:hypothetical protein
MYKVQRDSFTGEIRSVQIIENPMTSIPCDPANTDYQAYLAWLELGNEPLPAENT